MTENTWYSQGSFCWADVGTTDLDAARRFYEGLFGWDTEERDFGPNGTYLRFQTRGKFVAGAYALTDQAPPRWNSYINVDDAEHTAKQAEQLGATIVSPVEDIEPDGRMAKIADPTGAVIGLWQATGFIGADIIVEPGSLAWFELMTPDPKGAVAFYRELFGYDVQENQIASGTYHVLMHKGERACGIMAPPVEGPPTMWTPYFYVEDCRGTLDTATGLGATMMVPATETPGVGTLAWVSDPQGAAIAWIQPAPRQAETNG